MLVEVRKTELGWEDGRDLSQIAVIIGMSVCPSPKGDGMVLSPFLGEGVVEFAVNGLCHGLTEGNGCLVGGMKNGLGM